MENGLAPQTQQALDRVATELVRGNRAIELLRIGYRMRQAQREYFGKRTRDNLIKSKELEKAFDAGLEDLRTKKD